MSFLREGRDSRMYNTRMQGGVIIFLSCSGFFLSGMDGFFLLDGWSVLMDGRIDIIGKG